MKKPIPPSAKGSGATKTSGSSKADQPPGDEELSAAVSAFLDKLPKRVAAMREALKAGREEELRELAHKLRSAGLFGYPQLGTIAEELENAVEDRRLADCGPLIEKLDAVVKKLPC